MRGRALQLGGVVLGIAILFGFAGSSMAAQKQKAAMGVCPVCANATDESASYPKKAGYTLVRGAANTLLGWTELIRQPVNEVNGGGNVFTGVAKGVGEGVKRTLGGVGEILTFWTPKVKGSYLHFSDNCPICMGKK